jgi:hypothetical protein
VGAQGREGSVDASGLSRRCRELDAAYRVTRKRAGGVGVEANSDDVSTHPVMPRILMRRHEPRTSPSCTREFGPIDATRRDDRLGPARTMTHSRATELTQRVDERVFAVGVAFRAGDVVLAAGGATLVVGFSIVEGDAAGLGMGFSAIDDDDPAGLGSGPGAVVAREAPFAFVDGVSSSRGMLSTFTSFISGIDVSAGVLATCDVASTLDFASAVVCASASRFGPLSRRRNPIKRMTTTAPAPTPFHTAGGIFEVSGLVPHHLQRPTVSG